jgi:RNA polymerase sigma-70 factor, ECF subfamily
MKQFRTVGRVTSLDDLDEDQDPMVPVRQEPLHQLLETELSDKVREAVQSLPPLQREALILFEYEGLALSEIAAVVGADVGTVKSRLYRARERLRNALHQYLNSNQEIVTLKEA